MTFQKETNKLEDNFDDGYSLYKCDCLKWAFILMQ